MYTLDMSRSSIVITLTSLAVSGAIALGQVNTASLTGLVKDPSDAVIVDAAVRAKSLATGVERSVVTNSSGYFFLANLPVGAYEVSVEKPGFQKALSTVPLGAAEKGRQDFTWAIGAVSTMTTVEASTPLLS